MAAISPVADPLTVLPPEIVLQILHFTPVSALASLTAASKAWHQFIDVTHQEAIYTSEAKTTQPLGGSRDLSFLSDTHSFAKVFEGTESWKDLCKRQTLLARNWAEPHPVSQESVLQIGNDHVWRFRADFKRRFFISTSHAGGMNVTDMDTGRILWQLPSVSSTEKDGVRPHAHLEYQDGMAVFDSEGDSLEVWQTDLEGAKRGEFRRIAILNHDCQTRGFQLSYWTLCVVSNEGRGFVYDMTQRPPKLTTRLKIEGGGIGHLDQSEDIVIYSMGAKGYFAYNKESGAFLGILKPSKSTEKYHILPPKAASASTSAALTGAAQLGPRPQPLPPGAFQKDRLVPIEVAKGPLSPPDDPDHVWHGEDEWGAGMLNGDLFVGFSRAGRVFICPDFRKALRDEASLAASSSILECESDGSSFDMGGWLSIRNHRVMFEIQDRIYVVALDDNNRVQTLESPARASYSLLTSSAPQLAVPVSYMALADDAIMTTYTTLGWRDPNIPGGTPPPQGRGIPRIFPIKVIRILSLAPNLSDKSSSASGDTDQPSAVDGLGGPALTLQSEGTWHPQDSLLQLIAMLGEDADLEQSDSEDEWESMDEVEDEEEEEI
ncbi:hypothetical protein PEX1_093000 [Penicillium expansum]|uniref:F-box domain-containing protein n=1 Tax=Penicillium expansum TaxID=27334 RepID=A0A0A2L081_PENEN|nr:hypothetical protein PEX2_046900 [Penicillium expansum]KGO39665.1 hypothetical protein PEXP_048410 [Penicillium expansum]KGO62664.1 hypothetical protein PEX2_046900 [Penicillium expansum]KGO73477.1 hypothetical protein PEX1_093000 [Penicillium expansum]